MLRVATQETLPTEKQRYESFLLDPSIPPDVKTILRGPGPIAQQTVRPSQFEVH